MSEIKDPYVKLAKKTLESYVKDKTVPDISDVDEELLNSKAGTFVSLKKDGQLRGCIGTIISTTGSIAEEIVQNAVSAGTRDPRFLPVTEDELEDIHYSVDVLMPAEPISSIDELDVKKYGVIVENGGRRGLLLPDLEGVDTPEEQLSIAMQKAGINPGEPIAVERFEVVRHGE